MAAKKSPSSSKFSWEPATDNHIALRQAILDKPIVFVNGPQGSGKTFNSFMTALELLAITGKNGGVDKIICIRPIVPAGDDLGALPGGVDEKIDPYYEAIFQTIRKSNHPDTQALLDGDRLELLALQLCRGQTFDDALIIVDEGQNLTPEQMEMVLGRLGPNSKMVICGDLNQKDFRKLDGFTHALRLFENDCMFGHIELTIDDIQRHPLVKHIIVTYNRDRELATQEREMLAQSRKLRVA